MLTTRLRRTVAAAAGAALAAAPLAVLSISSAPPAVAATNDQALSGNTSPMWQTNNNVEALAVSNGVVYAGGTFTSVRPPGAAAGTNETARTYLAAFNANTGALVNGFNVTLNGRVEDLTVSPDGSRLYIVGAFTTVNGNTRNRAAAINLPGGGLNGQFNPNLNRVATAVDAAGGAVWVGGDFSTVGGDSRPYLASVSATNGALNTGFNPGLFSAPPPAPPFSPAPSPRPLTIDFATGDGTAAGARLLVGGGFNAVDGVLTGGMLSMDPATGALEQWNANTTQPINTNCSARVTDIISDGDTAYVTAEGDPPGCYEGTYSARVSDGELLWNSTCLGASLGLALMDNVLYKASHQHDCAFNPGDARGGYVGGTSRDTFIWWRLVGQNVSDGSFVHWSPNTNIATGSNPVGPHVLATDGNSMFVGGDFSRVNTQPQQGLARFVRGSVATPTSPQAPVVQSTGVGRATVTWPAVIDRDSGTLTYRLFRNSGANPIYTTTVESFPWSRPMMRFDDTGLTPGNTYQYRLQVTDGVHTTGRGPNASVVIRTSAPATYADTVRDLGANLYWQLGDAGPAMTDSSATGTASGQLLGGADTQQPGAMTGNGALDLQGGYVTSDQPQVLTPSFTQSLWFRTTSTTGGSLLAVTDAQTGVGTLSDRAVTMDNNGNIVFSVHQPPRAGSPDPFGPRLNNVRLQGPIYNDGRWHQVVATWAWDPVTLTGTASLYLDGVLNGTYVGPAAGLTEAYQRVGYTDLRSEQAVFGRNYYAQKWPLTEQFNGSVDEVAIFPRALSAAEVTELYAAGVNNGG